MSPRKLPKNEEIEFKSAPNKIGFKTKPVLAFTDKYPGLTGHYWSDFYFEESELRSELDIPKKTPISDQARIDWGRKCIDKVLDEYDGYLLPSLHTYELKASDGSTATMGCLVEIHGQSGPVTIWRGLWRFRDAFLHSLGNEYEYWVTPLMGDIPDEVILKLWKSSKIKTKV